MKTRKVNTGVHEVQELHEAADCRINEKPHNHPDTDCGHRVEEGPGAVGMPDLNMYDEDHGKRLSLPAVRSTTWTRTRLMVRG